MMLPRLTAVFLILCVGGSVFAQLAPSTQPGGVGFMDLNYVRKLNGEAVVKTEKAAFLGVAVIPMSSELRKQLQLADGPGLVVRFVEPDSPAALAGIAQDDLLQKINDQMIFNHAQLAALTRWYKAGTKINVSLLRAGKPLTVTATLTEKEQPVAEDGTIPMPNRIILTAPNGMSPNMRDIIEREMPNLPPDLQRTLRGQMEQKPAPAPDGAVTIPLDIPDPNPDTPEKVEARARQRMQDQQQMMLQNMPGGIRLQMQQMQGNGAPVPMNFKSTSVESRNGKTVRTQTDNEHRIQITEEAGKDTQLNIQDREGKVLFDGPVSTDEQIKAIPAELKEKYEQVKEGNKNNVIKIGGAINGGNMIINGGSGITITTSTTQKAD